MNLLISKSRKQCVIGAEEGSCTGVVNIVLIITTE